MVLKQKYIKTDKNVIIVFPELLQHKEFKHFKPVSAGFISFGVELTCNGVTNNCVCYGESISLNLKSQEETDTALANKQILGNY